MTPKETPILVSYTWRHHAIRPAKKKREDLGYVFIALLIQNRKEKKTHPAPYIPPEIQNRQDNRKKQLERFNMKYRQVEHR